MIKKPLTLFMCREEAFLVRPAFFSRLLASGSLVLLSPSSEDEGYFECTAVNDVGEERRVIEVILQGNNWSFFIFFI